MPDAFAQLLAAHGPRVHRAAAGMLRDEQEAREVAQEALARAWAARERYDRRRPFYPWLATIVRNACRDAIARGKHRAIGGLDPERLTSASPTPLQSLSSKEAEGAVHDAMARLRDEWRDILLMRHFEDLSYAEIGQALGIPQGTVMSRLYRARKALTAELAQAGHAPSGGAR
ncbi:MAG: sigma-70 family RNA polymerase sigma factor [Deltaproteobacteria bacterium]|nr:sigma-70 family RNA polymerase sigma factor [Deltaproteobacteria bacterium]